MEKFRFFYSVEDVKTMLPLWVAVEADNREEAIAKAHEKLHEEDYHIKNGKSYTLYTN